MRTAAALAALAMLSACGKSKPALPAYGAVTGFELVDQNGKRFTPAQLAGHVWVADFIYTSCEGVCPRMTSQMGEVQKALSAFPDLRLVSFSVDPDNDTPEKLNAYAQLHHAREGVWYFLTGSKNTLQKLDRETFKLGNVDGSLQHSSRFVLVDPALQIRGYYDTSEKDAISRLLDDIARLEPGKS